jgi:hypothetical protein
LQEHGRGAKFDLGTWLEQLLAESTGKQGLGLIPVDREPLLAPQRYGKDRVFAYIKYASDADPNEAAVAALEETGQPVIRLVLKDLYDLGQTFFQWEMATAVAGSVIGIDAFNQPNVEASKIVTRELKRFREERDLATGAADFGARRHQAVDGQNQRRRFAGGRGADAGRGDSQASGPGEDGRLFRAVGLFADVYRKRSGVAGGSEKDSGSQAGSDGARVWAAFLAQHRAGV